jgi:hypothetical protein
LLVPVCLPATYLQALLEKEADLRQEELDEACAAAPVCRLVLLVHGVGQKLEAADIAQVRVCYFDPDVARLSSCCGVGDKQYPSCTHAELPGCLPVQRVNLPGCTDSRRRPALPAPAPAGVQDAGAFRSVLRQVAQDQSQQGLLDEQPRAGQWGEEGPAPRCLPAAGRPQKVLPLLPNVAEHWLQ